MARRNIYESMKNHYDALSDYIAALHLNPGAA
jgi:hypothetical protein